MKLKFTVLLTFFLLLLLSGCDIFSTERQISIKTPKHLLIEGPEEFNLMSNKARELQYKFTDDDKYKVININGDNCETINQGNGYFTIKNPTDNCVVSFNISQVRYDVSTVNIGDGRSDFISNSSVYSKDGIVEILALHNYNSKRVTVKTDGCDLITEDKDSIFIKVSNFISDCKVSLLYAKNESFKPTVEVELRNSTHYIGYSLYDKVNLRVVNNWSKLILDEITIKGHLYGINEKGVRKLLSQTTKVFRNVPASHSLESTIFNEEQPIKGYEFTKFEFEVLSATSCKFALWSTDNCLDILEPGYSSNRFGLKVEGAIILPN
ncbi:hypothetical protein E0Z06_06495 [Rheinheimera sp. D18]|uniref:hypothetical protein n=1 Tax=Rheinheimera sp. D18 TaxID=2545632 RepID=UPI00105214CD|nr:hypothetical protein [Rheinheimera sp. D18]QBL09186.1 hypothetical protein E0Z06_06495 [Rheinheimera sp. D18]